MQGLGFRGLGSMGQGLGFSHSAFQMDGGRNPNPVSILLRIEEILHHLGPLNHCNSLEFREYKCCTNSPIKRVTAKTLGLATLSLSLRVQGP